MKRYKKKKTKKKEYILDKYAGFIDDGSKKKVNYAETVDDIVYVSD